MGYHVDRLKRPYDYRVLIEAYVYARRDDFVHPDFTNYYVALLHALESLFAVRLSQNGLPPGRRALWSLFESTVTSMLQIASPWDGYLEAGLLHIKLEECGEPGVAVGRASAVIADANAASAAAHREILYALFRAIFGERDQVVTSEDLRAAGFDDSKEPSIVDYFDRM